MRPGQYFELYGRVFKVSSLHAPCDDGEGDSMVRALVAECLTPREDDNGTWWTIELAGAPLETMTQH